MTVLFLPGFKENLKSRDYTAVIKAIENKGYTVKFVPIKWDRTTIEDWVREVEAVYTKQDPKQTILAGFSYGAMTAFMCATKQNPAELWLFSLSPYFAEDFKSSEWKPRWEKSIGKKRTKTFKKLSFKALSKNIKCKTLIFIGQKEIDKFLITHERSIEAHELIDNNELHVIPEADHDVADPNYIKAISKVT